MPQTTAPLSSFSTLISKAARDVANPEAAAALAAKLSAERLANIEDPYAARIQDWLAATARKHWIRNGPARRARPDEAKALGDWAKKAQNGGTLLLLELDDPEIREADEIVDYLLSEKPKQIEKISYPQAREASKKWHETISRDGQHEDDPEGVDAFAEVSDAPDDTPAHETHPKGSRWVKLTSPKALSREGLLMRHCVGSYASRVESGALSIYSLRSPENKPIITIEVSHAAGACEIRQVRKSCNAMADQRDSAALKAFVAALAAERGAGKVSSGPELASSGCVFDPKSCQLLTLSELPEGWVVDAETRIHRRIPPNIDKLVFAKSLHMFAIDFSAVSKPLALRSKDSTVYIQCDRHRPARRVDIEVQGARHLEVRLPARVGEIRLSAPGALLDAKSDELMRGEICWAEGDPALKDLASHWSQWCDIERPFADSASLQGRRVSLSGLNARSITVDSTEQSVAQSIRADSLNFSSEHLIYQSEIAGLWTHTQAPEKSTLDNSKKAIEDFDDIASGYDLSRAMADKAFRLARQGPAADTEARLSLSEALSCFNISSARNMDAMPIGAGISGPLGMVSLGYLNLFARSALEEAARKNADAARGTEWARACAGLLDPASLPEGKPSEWRAAMSYSASELLGAIRERPMGCAILAPNCSNRDLDAAFEDAELRVLLRLLGSSRAEARESDVRALAVACGLDEHSANLHWQRVQNTKDHYMAQYGEGTWLRPLGLAHALDPKGDGPRAARIMAGDDIAALGRWNPRHHEKIASASENDRDAFGRQALDAMALALCRPESLEEISLKAAPPAPEMPFPMPELRAASAFAGLAAAMFCCRHGIDYRGQSAADFAQGLCQALVLATSEPGAPLANDIELALSASLCERAMKHSELSAWKKHVKAPDWESDEYRSDMQRIIDKALARGKESIDHAIDWGELAQSLALLGAGQAGSLASKAVDSLCKESAKSATKAILPSAWLPAEIKSRQERQGELPEAPLAIAAAASAARLLDPESAFGLGSAESEYAACEALARMAKADFTASDQSQTGCSVQRFALEAKKVAANAPAGAFLGALAKFKPEDSDWTPFASQLALWAASPEDMRPKLGTAVLGLSREESISKLEEGAAKGLTFAQAMGPGAWRAIALAPALLEKWAERATSCAKLHASWKPHIAKELISASLTHPVSQAWLKAGAMPASKPAASISAKAPKI